MLNSEIAVKAIEGYNGFFSTIVYTRKEKNVITTGTVFQTATAKAQRIYLDRKAFNSAKRFSFTMLLKRCSHAKNLMIRIFCSTSFVVWIRLSVAAMIFFWNLPNPLAKAILIGKRITITTS